MADAPAPPPAKPTPPAETPPTRAARRSDQVHEVSFVAHPKLFFAWPLILAGFVLYPLAWPPPQPPAGPAPEVPNAAAPAGPSDDASATTAGPAAPWTSHPGTSRRLEVVGWVYIWVLVIVLLALGVDIERNHAIFLLVLVAAIWLLGLWLRDTRHFTMFGDIYRWFAQLDVQYDRKFGLAVSIVALVPYLLMLFWARLNDRWRITHNEFEHYSFGKMNDSLGRGAKTIRTDFPDVLEMLLGLAGTLIVYNASGTRELRRIPHVLLLPIVRRKLNRILERTAVTAAQIEDEEEEETQ